MVRLTCTLIACVAGCGFTKELGIGGDNTQPGGDASNTAPDGPPPCTPEFRASRTSTAPSGDSVDAAAPAGMNVDDVMIATVLYQPDSDEQPRDLVTPTGWTLIRRDAFTNDGSVGQNMYWKAVTANEPATYQFTSADGSKRFVASIAAYWNVDTANPISANGGQMNTSSTTVDAQPIIVGTCGRLVGSFGTRVATSFQPPTPMSEREDKSTAAITLTVADALLEGDTGPCAATAGNAAINIGQLVALKPR